MRTRTALSANWQWRLVSANGDKTGEQQAAALHLHEWHAAGRLPSEIHLELLDRGMILDPNVGQNERKIQWVGRADWAYRCVFDAPGEQQEHVELFFEGLDTFATVTLNGQKILESENMFVPERMDVKKLLRQGGNELVILFESAYKKGVELEKLWGERTSMMRDKKRMNMRKAQYSWGWDWGPTLLTAGPYLPVYLDTYDYRIDNAHVTTKLADDLSTARVSVDVNLFPSGAESDLEAAVELQGPGGNAIDSKSIKVSKQSRLEFVVQNPQLWWPNGQGEQPLYTAHVNLLKGKTVLDSLTTRFGVRSIKLIQRPLEDAPGKTFMFCVNNRNIFIQGGDWIPADNLLPRLTRDRYFAWMALAKKNNLNMIRVWGGGIYETEDFWDACDELGLLVWQDYAFACGDYPTHPDFLANIKREAEAQTVRIRNRASLALLCGGNEDFMFADWKGEYDHDDVTGPFDQTPFPQRVIYLTILTEVVRKYAPDVEYWANSPYGGPKANDDTIGDMHQWDVWHAKQLPYQQYGQLSGRFVSEFGMHGFPDMRTVNVFAPNPSDRHPQSKTIDCHNKGHGAETRIARYMAENFRYTQDLEVFTYVSQLIQSEAYGYALRDWKRKFQGPGREYCAGAIIWQFNDVYPCTSWAYVDYYLRPKPAYYTIRRAYTPISVGIERTPRSRFIDEDNPRETEIPQFSIFAHNTTPIEKEFTLVIKAYDFFTQQYIDYPNSRRQVKLLPGQNTELGTVENPSDLTEESLIILSATLLDGDGEVAARIVDWPEPFRYLEWPRDTDVKVSVSAEAGKSRGQKVDVVSNRPVKGCLLYVGYDDGEDAEWEDNMVDLLPGETVALNVRGLDGREIKAKWLKNWER